MNKSNLFNLVIVLLGIILLIVSFKYSKQNNSQNQQPEQAQVIADQNNISINASSIIDQYPSVNLDSSSLQKELSAIHYFDDKRISYNPTGKEVQYVTVKHLKLIYADARPLQPPGNLPAIELKFQNNYDSSTQTQTITFYQTPDYITHHDLDTIDRTYRMLTLETLYNLSHSKSFADSNDQQNTHDVFINNMKNMEFIKLYK